MAFGDLASRLPQGGWRASSRTASWLRRA
jgi:hypothetical protein